MIWVATGADTGILHILVRTKGSVGLRASEAAKIVTIISALELMRKIASSDAKLNIAVSDDD